MLSVKRIVVPFSAFMIAAAGAVIAPQSSAIAAPTCYGDYCSGQNPYDTGCIDGAYIWGQADVRQTPGDPNYPGVVAGTVQLWVSPSCGTQWARLDLHMQAPVDYIQVYQADTGYAQTADVPNGLPGGYYTYMIYSRDKCSYAFAAGGIDGGQTGCAVQ